MAKKANDYGPFQPSVLNGESSLPGYLLPQGPKWAT